MTWYVSIDGIASGPFSETELVRKAQAGDLPSGALVWCDGMDTWQPLAARFPEACRPRPADRARTTLPGSRASSLWPWHFAVIAIAGALIWGSLASLQAVELSDQPLVLYALWLITGLGACAILGLAIRWFFKQTESPAHRLFALTVYGLTGTALLVCTALPAHQMWLIAYGLHEDQSYSISVDPSGTTLSISGSIGGGISKRVNDLVEANPQLEKVEIDSLGGFLTQAYSIANMIKAHGFDAAAHGQCASACLPILMSGRNRYAEVGTKLGFHTPFLLEGMSAWSTYVAGDVKGDYFKILRDSGMPEQFIKLASSTPPDGMTWVDSIRLAKAGVLTMTVGGKSVAIPAAEWAWLVKDFRGRGDAGDTAIAGIYEAIGTAIPGFPGDTADKLYEIAQSEDKSGIAHETRDIIAAVMPPARKSAGPAELTALSVAIGQLLDDMKERKDWDQCNAFIDGTAQKVNFDAYPTPHLVDLLNSFSGVIRSAGEAGWAPAPVFKADKQSATQLELAVLTELSRAGQLPANWTANSEASCRFGVALYHRIAALEGNRGGIMFRAINAL